MIAFDGLVIEPSELGRRKERQLLFVLEKCRWFCHLQRRIEIILLGIAVNVCDTRAS